MGFIAGIFTSVLAYILKWILESGGRYIYEKSNELIEAKKQEKRAKEALQKYKDAIKKGASDDEILKRESDILNGN